MLIVQKFGGTSVGSIDRIKKVAQLVIQEREAGNQVIVVVSAMSGVTTQLVNYTQEVSNLLTQDSLAEYDSVVSSGEQVTSGLLALQLQSMGYKSRSFLGWQIGLETCQKHSKSKIGNINNKIIEKYIRDDYIAVVAGFQGVTKNARISTMGRGGSDTSAVAIAASVSADRCDIYTDVNGIYSADPRIVKDAICYNEIAYSEAIEMTSLGAKILHTRSVEMAIKHEVKLQVLSSFAEKTDKNGTILVKDKDIMEKRLVTAVAHSKDEARVTIKNVDNEPGIVAKIFKPLGDAGLNLDVIIQNISYNGKKANVTFTVKEADLSRAVAILNDCKEKSLFKCEDIVGDDTISKVSVIGIGMQDSSGVAYDMFGAMADSNINILAISTSEIKISILIEEDKTEEAVKILHKKFIG